MQKVIVGGVVGGVILIGGWYLLGADTREAEQMKSESAARETAALVENEVSEVDTMKKDEAMADTEMMKKDEGMAEKDMMKNDMQKASPAEVGMEGKAGMYAPYAAEKLAMANDGDVVLFFKASWCPSCRALDANLRASLADIPAGLTILEVDYDTALALRQQYGVTTQHTLVQVGANGTLIKKWSGGSTLASIVAEVQ